MKKLVNTGYAKSFLQLVGILTLPSTFRYVSLHPDGSCHVHANIAQMAPSYRCNRTDHKCRDSISGPDAKNSTQSKEVSLYS